MDTQLAPPINGWESYVSKAIEDLKVKYPKLNLSQIAMKINLNRSTLTRIINEGIKPQLDNYIKIIIGSGNGEMINEALAAYDESLAASSNNVYKVALSEKNRVFTDQEMEKILDEGDNLIIYVLALKENGTNADEICHVLGTKGIEAMNDMIDLGLLSNDSNIVKTTSTNKIIMRSFDGLRKRIKTYSQFYRPSHAYRDRNYIHTLTEGMNEDGIKKMQTLHRNFHHEMVKIIRSPENQGDIPMFSVAFCDSLTSIDYKFNLEILQ